MPACRADAAGGGGSGRDGPATWRSLLEQPEGMWVLADPLIHHKAMRYRRAVGRCCRGGYSCRAGYVIGRKRYAAVGRPQVMKDGPDWQL